MYTSEQIKDYLLSRLPAADMAAMQRAISEDPALAERVRSAKMWLVAERLNTQAQVDEAIEYAQQQRNARVRRRWVVGLTAAILVGAGVWFLWPPPTTDSDLVPAEEEMKDGVQSNDTTTVSPSTPIASDDPKTNTKSKPTTPATPSPAELAANGYAGLKLPTAKSSDGITTVSEQGCGDQAAFSQALADLQAQNSKAAAQQLEGCTHPDWLYLRGLAAMQSGHYGEAQKHFAQVEANLKNTRQYINERYKDDLAYAQLLCHLATEDWETFDAMAAQWPDKHGKYREEVAQLKAQTRNIARRPQGFNSQPPVQGILHHAATMLLMFKPNS